jgi:hypothetical protein
MSQPLRPPRPVTGIALLFCVCVVFIVCNVSFSVCVAFCALLFERCVLICMICVFLFCILL